MYERLLDKGSEPAPEQIEAYLGGPGYARLMKLEAYLRANYRLSREIRFPFGNNYGWGYKYNHGAAHLCYAFFEKGAFTVTIQIGDKQVPSVEERMDALSPKARELWADRYPCGDRGGWVHYRVLEDGELDDVFRLIGAKRAPLG